MDQTRLNKELYNEFEKEVLDREKIIELIKKDLKKKFLKSYLYYKVQINLHGHVST